MGVVSAGSSVAVGLLALSNLVLVLWPAPPSTIVRERVVAATEAAREACQCQAADQCLVEVQRLSRNDSFLRVNVVFGLSNVAVCLALACWACRGRASPAAVSGLAVPVSARRYSDWAEDSDNELAGYKPPSRGNSKPCR